MNLSVGVTGHRDLVEQEKPALANRVRALFEELHHRYPDLDLQLLSGLADGADRLVAGVALELSIPVVAVLPLEREDYSRDFTTASSREEFQQMLERAERVIELPAMSASEPDGAARDRHYAQQGVFLSNHCQVLLALWDGKPSDAVGGTAEVVRYHLTGVMKGIDSEPSSAALLAENENDLVHQVVCSRDRPDGEPAPWLEPLQSAWFTSQDEGKRSPEIPEAYDTLLQRLQRFARDWREKEEAIRTSSEPLLADAPDLDIPSGAEITDRLFHAADGLAIHYQRRVNSSLRATYALAVLMGLVFLLWSEFEGPRYMILAFLGLFFAGIGLHLVGESREWHRKYLDYRTLAEGLRVQVYWNLAGVVDSTDVGFAYQNFLQSQDVDLGWIRHVMRQASMQRLRGRLPDPAWVPWVIDDWVGQDGGHRGQLAYYSYKERHNGIRYRRTQLLGSLCLWSGITIAILLFAVGESAGEGLRNVLLVLMGVLPLVAGIWDAYSNKKAEKELIRQYGFMRGVFLRARKLLDGSSDLPFQRKVLRALGEAALDEGAEWLLMHRERPPEHGRL